MSTRYETFQIRRGSSADFAAANTLLASGEPAYAIDTKVFKIGDGVSRWNSLGGITGDTPQGVASENYVLNAISGVIDSAPELLNTLNELAAALGDDANFATTVVSSLNQKANLAGGNTFTGYNIIPSGSGNFNILSISGVGVSVVGHSHLSSDITNFNTSVSGLVAGYYAPLSGANFTGSISSPSGSFTNSLKIGGVNVSVSGHTHVISDITNLQTTLDNKQPSGSYAPLVHTHVISDVTGLQSALDLKQPSGSYAPLSHTHTASNITDFSSSVSGLLPVKNVVGTGYVNVVSTTGNFTVSVTGLQPSGSYAPLSHTHTASNITDFNTSVSGLVNGIYAPLSSPTLTGIPLTPTASSGTNTNQIASTSFVRTEISNLVASAPSTLDTLNELATALGNDPNFATTITNNLASKAALSGATFTGSISSPSGDFSQSLKVNGTNVSVSGHIHIIGDVTGLQSALDLKQPSGSYAASSHTHTSSSITDFNSSVSGLVSGIYAPIASPTFTGYVTIPSGNVNTLIINSGTTPNNTSNTLYNVSGQPYFASNAFALLPSGGTIGQILNKVDNTSYALAWIDNYATELSVYVKNTTGSSLTKGQAVYINGAQGDNPTITLAIASSEAGSSKTLGLLRQDLAVNEFGYVVCEGILEGLDTSGANQAGDTMWLSPSISGGVVYGTNNKPSAPYHMVFIGYVIRKQSNNGKVFIKVQNGFELEELHNVAISGLSNNQIIKYDSSSSLWKNSDLVSSYVTDFNSSVSGLLPVKNITASSYVNVTSTTGNYTISVTGLQPSGSYASSAHTHTASQITDFNSSVSGLLPTISNSGDNRVLTSTGSTVGINAESNLTFDGTNFSAPYLLSSYASGDEGGEIQLAKPPNGTLAGGITIDSYQNRLRFFEQGGTARGFYLDLSSAGAGVSTNLAAGGGSATTVTNYADNRVITSDGTSTGLYAESNFTFNGSLLTSPSGNFTQSLQLNGTGVSLAGHTHTASQISDSTTAGRALLTGADAAAQRTSLGLGTLATQTGTFSGTSSGTNTGDQTISISGDVTAAGSTGSLNATVTKINGTLLSGLTTGLLKNTTGTGTPSIAVAGTDYAAASHTHTASNITDFASSVSGLLPVKNIVAGTNISVSSTSGVYTINATVSGANRGVINATGTLSSFSVTGGYTTGNIDLFQNGVKLISGSDFTATDGSSIALAIGVPSGTVLEYVAMGNTAATTIGISAGTVAAPSISSSSDLGTGFYFPASGSVAIANTGVQSFIANSSGNIGIGIGSPTSKLHVVGNTNLAGTLTFNDFTESVVVIGNSATAKTIALTSGTVQTCTLTGNCTFTMPTATAGKSFTLFLSSGAGSFTATFTGVKWSGGTAPTITTTASKVDILSFISDGTSWYGAFSQNY